MIRPSLSFVLWLLRSCLYLQERWTVEPANMMQLSQYYESILAQLVKNGKMSLYMFIHPRSQETGLSKKDWVKLSVVARVRKVAR